MYVCEKLQLNKLVQVAIPKNNQFFARLGGYRPRPISGTFSGDDVLPLQSSKMDSLNSAQKIALNEVRARAAKAAEEAREAGEK